MEIDELLTPARSCVMVVDDEPNTAHLIAGIVNRLGHKAIVCQTWTDALRVFDPQTIDLVLMDAVMPTVDGFKLTRILRGRSTTYVPIVFLTGLADQAAREQGVAAGADDFLSKPVNALELRVRMTAMLRIRSLTRRLEARSAVLSRLASVDGLTGIGNRRSFDDRLEAMVEQARTRGVPLTLLLLDIDHFKRVNDQHGHAVGDEILVAFGRLLSETTRACDQPFRFGGEEFAVLAASTRAEQAVSLAERIRNAFALRSKEATAGGPQSVSIGFCSTAQLDADASPLMLVQAADAALYRAKATGRNRVCCYEPALDAPSSSTNRVSPRKAA